MRRAWLAIGVGSAVLAIGAACTSFAGSGDSSPDGGGPSPTPDGGGTADAPDVLPSDAGFCASESPKHTFCADFDTPHQVIETGWKSVSDNTTAGGQLGFDLQKFVSAPAAFAAELPNGDGGAEGRARLCTDLAFGSQIHIAMNARIIRIDEVQQEEVSLVSLRWAYQDAGDETFYTDVFSAGGVWGVRPSNNKLGTNVRLIFTKQPPTDQWFKLDIAVTVAAGTGPGTSTISETVAIDGVPVVDDSQPWPLPDGTPTVCVGITYALDWAQAMRMLYDNVTIDVASP
jgi:hypothetical protein